MHENLKSYFNYVWVDLRMGRQGAVDPVLLQEEA